MTLEFGQELAQEGDFQEDVAKEISVVKGEDFLGSLLFFLLPG